MLENILGAATNLFGGLLGKSSADKANETNAAMAAQNIALQREFAQNAIQWKVADAKAAGLHPLAALGASTTSFAPVTVGASGANPLADSLRSMGQDLSRSASVNRSAPGRLGAIQTAQQTESNSLDLENKRLNNEILKSRLVTMNQPATPPPIPDSSNPFPVPENTKVENRPPLMLFGKRWMTNPNTSPMKAFEDQYGDEGPASWVLPPLIAANDAAHNLASRMGWNPESFARGYIASMGKIYDHRPATWPGVYYNKNNALPSRPSYRPPRY